MRVAVCQLNARDDRKTNLAAAEDLLTRAAAAGADLAVLPEYVDYLGPAAGQPEPEPADGEFATFFAAIARRLGIWVHAGSFHEVGPDPEHTYNTTLLFDRSGALAATYRKIHLYDVEIPGRVSYLESRTVAPGAEPVVADVDGVRVGLSICYDLRFPELYRQLATSGGAQLLLVPAAFMLHTGRDHWEVLLRARAIENQCYVAAAGQIGDHEPGRTCFGRSMVIDPWGTVLAQAPDTAGIVVCDLDLDRLRAIRAELPSLANRRLRGSALQQHPDHGEADDRGGGDQESGGHPGRTPPRQPSYGRDRRHEHEGPDDQLPEGQQQPGQRILGEHQPRHLRYGSHSCHCDMCGRPSAGLKLPGVDRSVPVPALDEWAAVRHRLGHSGI